MWFLVSPYISKSVAVDFQSSVIESFIHSLVHAFMQSCIQVFTRACMHACMHYSHFNPLHSICPSISFHLISFHPPMHCIHSSIYNNHLAPENLISCLAIQAFMCVYHHFCHKDCANHNDDGHDNDSHWEDDYDSVW